MSILEINDLSFSYDSGTVPIFEHVSFRLDTDWRLGFTGRNGRGKTTFLKLLLGEYEYSGTIRCTMPFVYYPFPVENESEWVCDIVSERLGDENMWRFRKELSALGVSEDAIYRPYNTLSGGEQTKVQTALLFSRENCFYLLDEPTNHLDRAARETLGKYLARKKGFILVSHDRALLDACTDHTLSVNKTNIEIQKGSFSQWQENKAQRDAFEAAENEKLQKEITRLQTAAARTAGWSRQAEASKNGTRNSGLRPDRGFIGHKSAKMMQRAKSIAQRRETAISEKEALLKNIETAETLKLTPLPFKSHMLAELRDLQVRYDGNPIFAPVSFSICQGDKIHLYGENGAGKTSIFKLLCGEELSYSGNLYVAKDLVVSCLPQGSQGLHGTLQDFLKENALNETLFYTILRKLDFSREQFLCRLENCSAGQKKKVQLARCLCTPAHLYILDEPLNYMDVWSRIQLENLFRDTEATLLFAEHDAAFCENAATKTVHLQK